MGVTSGPEGAMATPIKLAPVMQFKMSEVKMSIVF